MNKIAIRLSVLIVASAALLTQTGCRATGLLRDGCSCCQPSCPAVKCDPSLAQSPAKQIETAAQENVSELQMVDVDARSTAEVALPVLVDANLDF